jgi:hypothetical protein
MNSPDTFGQWMKQRRKELDLTREELAGRVACSPVAIKKIEADERRPSKPMADVKNCGRRESESVMLWFGSGGGAVVAHPAGHNLDGNIRRLLQRTAGDCAMAFQHIKQLGADIADGRAGLERRHDRASQVGLRGGFAFKQVDTARLVLGLVHQPDLPAQAGHVGNRLGGSEPCRL